ncbi:UDP-N-acetylmuramate--L-alanine ligase [Streptomyces bauhiniae]|uniref:UDP-N-acetylmuramate--L-alanine ligase n=1 Tax=Streptomyces bauhiniae TaxID=2340725 RepID=UPI00364B7996
MAETAVPTIRPDSSARPLDLSRLHFVGIGGIGMLPVARVCAEQGHTVSGSDVRITDGLDELARLGVRVYTGHRAGNVPADASAVVFTHAIAEDNPEIVAARELGLPVVHRSAVLNGLMEVHARSIAVMGTHGKTSTAGMLAFALARAGRQPSYAIGGDLDVPGSGGHQGTAWGSFVAEVDESDRSHLGVNMHVAVITNIAWDHPENYSSEDEVVDAFEECIRLGLHERGKLVLDADSAGARELASRLGSDGPRVVTFGFSPTADWRLSEPSTQGRHTRSVLRGPHGGTYELVLRTAGTHQLLNAAAAIASLDVLGVDCDEAVDQLGYFDGMVRRMTAAGEAAGVRVYDSFAHHPEEVEADLAAARSLAGQGRVITVFQPSGALRLEVFGDGFARALAGSDEVVLTDSTHSIVGALETLSERIGGVSRGVVPDRAEAAVLAASVARPGDVVVLMGPGDITEVGQVVRAELGAQLPAVA